MEWLHKIIIYYSTFWWQMSKQFDRLLTFLLVTFCGFDKIITLHNAHDMTDGWDNFQNKLDWPEWEAAHEMECDQRGHAG